MKVLILDDEEIIRVSVCDELRDAGYSAETADRAQGALERLRAEPFDVVVADIRMPDMDGLAFLEAARQEHPGLVVIMMTAYAAVETAVRAMKLGAYDYLVKPFDSEELILILNRLRDHRQVLEENCRLRSALVERHGFHSLVGSSPAMLKVYETLGVVCPSDCTVLICGETGTGKERVAEAIHYNGPRKQGPLVKVSCATLSRDVLESELFGHVRGAFTGAIADKKGRIEAADKGTVFLDEVDDIPLESQVKLLRILECQEFERVGESLTRRADIRVIAATKADLRERVAQGRFRDDLFYRLNVVPIHLPPLREHREDLPLLIAHFIEYFARQPGSEARLDLTPDALSFLLDYPWPGNVRELKNLVERLLVIRRGGIVRAEDLPGEIRFPKLGELSVPAGATFDQVIASVERRLIQDALERAKGNKTKAAEFLGMTSSTFRYKLSLLISQGALKDLP
ncbi:MAG: sigma-54-dependent Fis family transcriptional regulator [Candidatus Latescibacteria bacterium]|nr:sigma-54-dependent Fis family transcriptional regulator [Candidatus Latescibacterota bacterium]